jgi:hypothetical protein
MSKVIFITLLFSFSLFAEEYGGKITAKDRITLAKALESKSGKNLLVQAKVGKVCQKKGCWMTLESKNGDIRVTFKDYSFFVPMSLIGKNVLVQSDLIEKKMTLEETRHYILDEDGDPSNITEARTEYRIVASGIKTL